MTNLAINEQMVSELLSSSEEFPIDFEMAWQWAGYARKDNAVRNLKRYFIEGQDFSASKRSASVSGGLSISYALTNDCFKEFCMVAKTEKGKEVRRYYLNCEKQLKVKSRPSLTPVEESVIIAESFSRLLGSVKLGRNEDEKTALLAGVNLTVMGMRHPEMRGELMEYHKLLAASTPTQSILLTPTTIGEKLGISARSVNNLLIDAGLQTRVPKEQRSKGEPDYRPTAEGARFSSNTLSTGNSGDVSTYQHIKWASETVDVLADFMTARSEGAS